MCHARKYPCAIHRWFLIKSSLLSPIWKFQLTLTEVSLLHFWGFETSHPFRISSGPSLG